MVEELGVLRHEKFVAFMLIQGRCSDDLTQGFVFDDRVFGSYVFVKCFRKQREHGNVITLFLVAVELNMATEALDLVFDYQALPAWQGLSGQQEYVEP